jgi:transposase
MGTKRDLESLRELEQRRRLAAELLRRGLRPAEVARRVNSSRQSVLRWERRLEQDGIRGLRRAGRVGRPPVLTDTQLEELAKQLKAGALAARYATEMWTLPRIGGAHRAQYRGAPRPQLRVAHLAADGLECCVQRPASRARQQDPAAVMQWKQKRWPSLKKALRGKDE